LKNEKGSEIMKILDEARIKTKIKMSRVGNKEFLSN